MKRPPGVTPPEPEPTRAVPARDGSKRDRSWLGRSAPSELPTQGPDESPSNELLTAAPGAVSPDPWKPTSPRLVDSRSHVPALENDNDTVPLGTHGSEGFAARLARVPSLGRFGRGRGAADSAADPVEQVNTASPIGRASSSVGAVSAGTSVTRNNAVRDTTVREGVSSDSNSTEPIDVAPVALGSPAVQSGSSAPSAKARLRDAERTRRRYEKNEAKRFTVGTRRRRIKLIIGAGVTAALVLLVVLTAYSPLLSLRTIDVQGTSRVDPALVSAKLGDQLGRPLSLIDFGEVERTLGSFPLVQSYVTETRPPDTLVIKIVERQPIASIQTDTGYQLIDPVGVVVETAQERVPGYPLLDTAITPKDSKQFAAIGAVMLAIPEELRAQVQSVSAETPDSIRFVLSATGNSVLWGSSEQSALKARILASMLLQPDFAGATEIDVSSPDAPVVR